MAAAVTKAAEVEATLVVVVDTKEAEAATVEVRNQTYQLHFLNLFLADQQINQAAMVVASNRYGLPISVLKQNINTNSRAAVAGTRFLALS